MSAASIILAIGNGIQDFGEGASGIVSAFTGEDEEKDDKREDKDRKMLVVLGVVGIVIAVIGLLISIFRR